ncbi:MAG: hypothetical protein WCW27_00405 [Patescibacteria group bacterium]|jgi:hypothetical protein
MTIKYTLTKPINLSSVLRQMGFHPLENSWVRTLGRYYYPRFHMYIETATPNELVLDLHLDQKQTTIKFNNKRHAGEYHGAVVEAEADRIKRWLDYAQTQ